MMLGISTGMSTKVGTEHGNSFRMRENEGVSGICFGQLVSLDFFLEQAIKESKKPLGAFVRCNGGLE
jgi:hypothetical protein